jgi:hypothetical protein
MDDQKQSKTVEDYWSLIEWEKKSDLQITGCLIIHAYNFF